jgi:hypothetical protein
MVPIPPDKPKVVAAHTVKQMLRTRTPATTTRQRLAPRLHPFHGPEQNVFWFEDDSEPLGEDDGKN